MFVYHQLTARGYYIYFEASYGSPGDKARLLSPSLLSYGKYCVEFFYHMYGASMGSLRVNVETSSSKHLVWSIHGNQGRKWRFGQVEIDLKTSSKVDICLLHFIRNLLRPSDCALILVTRWMFFWRNLLLFILVYVWYLFISQNLQHSHVPPDANNV